ncbi:toll-like receptor 13 [Haliotis rufescens]|uniref:toll-like receptor 13 n=1 Tax=Haliotis rufescens TaxID=6454 RepID=UPI00201F41AC|nr:toll-like receptor 13 [Haliotis rufescens]
MARLLEITICAIACAMILPSNTEGAVVLCGKVYRPCFESLCRCSDKCVSCTNNAENLTRIPDLRPTTEFLNFSSNYLGELTRDMLRNITQLKVLILRNNSITNISRDTFQDMLMLVVLDLRYSSVSVSVLQASFHSLHNTLRTLDVSHNRFLRNITEDFVDGLTRLNIISLKMGFCHLKYVNFSVISRLDSLRVLYVVYNDIAWTTAEVPWYLTVISFRSNSLTELPRFCDNTNNSQLQSLDLRQNAIRYMSNVSLKCLKKLKYFNFIENLITKIHSNTFSSLPNLQFIALSNAFRSYEAEERLEEYAFNNSAVKKLYLSGIAKFGYFDFIVNVKALRGCTGVTWLDLSYNTMLYFNDSFFETILSGLDKIEMLRMPRCQLSFFPNVISNFRELKELDLHGNRITSLDPGVFTNLTKLRRIRLSQNAIQVVSEAVFPVPIRNQLTNVNLAKNDYLCTCANLWFITWVQTDKHIFTDFPDLYQCEYPPNLKSTLLIDANVSEETCRISPYVFPIVYGFSIVSIVLIVVFSIAYRLRWRIRYYIHMLRYKKRKEVDEERYIYDAFVVYCEDDSRWVRNNILPRIEDEANFKLCIHERDFVPGKYIVDNIVTNLDNSRNVIMVLSNYFILSPWCQFELTLIQKQALEKDEGYVVVVLLENIEARNMTSSLYALFQTTTYITWPDEEEDRHVFWMRLKQCLQR